jgi:hypothetical protein
MAWFPDAFRCIVSHAREVGDIVVGATTQQSASQTCNLHAKSPRGVFPLSQQTSCLAQSYSMREI